MELCKHDWVGDDNCAYCRAESLEDELEESKEIAYKYADLIMSVASKYPDESRHDTAKRYILKAESRQHGSAQEIPTEKQSE